MSSRRPSVFASDIFFDIERKLAAETTGLLQTSLRVRSKMECEVVWGHTILTARQRYEWCATHQYQGLRIDLMRREHLSDLTSAQLTYEGASIWCCTSHSARATVAGATPNTSSFVVWGQTRVFGGHSYNRLPRGSFIYIRQTYADN
jgi:hypothetical protein